MPTTEELLAEMRREEERKKRGKGRVTSSAAGAAAAYTGRPYGGYQMAEPASKALERQAFAPSADTQRRVKQYPVVDYKAPETKAYMNRSRENRERATAYGGVYTPPRPFSQFDSPATPDRDVIKTVRQNYGPQWGDMTDQARIKALSDVYQTKYGDAQGDPKYRQFRTQWINRQLTSIDPNWERENVSTNTPIKRYEDYARPFGVDLDKTPGFVDLSKNPEWKALQPSQMRTVLGTYYDKMTGDRKGPINYKQREDFINSGLITSFGGNPWEGAEPALANMRPSMSDTLLDQQGNVRQLDRYKTLTNQSLWWSNLTPEKKRLVLQRDFDKYAPQLSANGKSPAEIAAMREDFIAKQMSLTPDYDVTAGLKQYGKSVGKGLLGVAGEIGGKATRSWETYSIVDPTLSQRLADYNDQQFGSSDAQQQSLQEEYGAKRFLPGLPVAEAPGMGESIKQSMAISLPAQAIGYGLGALAAAASSEGGPAASGAAFKGAQMAASGIVSYALTRRLTSYDMIRDLMNFEKQQFEQSHPGQAWTKENEQIVRDKYRDAIGEYAQAEALPEAGSEMVTSLFVPGAGKVVGKAVTGTGVKLGAKELAAGVGEKLLGAMGKDGVAAFEKFMANKAVQTAGKVVGKVALPEVAGAVAEVPSEVVTQGWEERIGQRPELRGTQYEARGSGEINPENIMRWTREVGPQAIAQGLLMGAGGHIISRAHEGISARREIKFDGAKGEVKAASTIKKFDRLMDTKGSIVESLIPAMVSETTKFKGSHASTVADAITGKALQHIDSKITKGEPVLAVNGGQIRHSDLKQMDTAVSERAVREPGNKTAQKQAEQVRGLYVSSLEGKISNLEPLVQKKTATPQQIEVYNSSVAELQQLTGREVARDTQSQERMGGPVPQGKELGRAVQETGGRPGEIAGSGILQTPGPEQGQVVAPDQAQLAPIAEPAQIESQLAPPQTGQIAAQPTAGQSVAEPALSAGEGRGATQAQTAPAPAPSRHATKAEQRIAALPSTASFEQYIGAKLPGYSPQSNEEIQQLREEYNAWQNEPARQEDATRRQAVAEAFSGLPAGLTHEEFAQAVKMDPGAAETELAYEDYQATHEELKFSKKDEEPPGKKTPGETKKTRMTGMKVTEALKEAFGKKDKVEPIAFDDDTKTEIVDSPPTEPPPSSKVSMFYWAKWLENDLPGIAKIFQDKVGTDANGIVHPIENLAAWAKGHKLVPVVTFHGTDQTGLFEKGEVDPSLGNGNMGDGFYLSTDKATAEGRIASPDPIAGGFIMPSIVRFKNDFTFHLKPKQEAATSYLNDFRDFAEINRIKIDGGKIDSAIGELKSGSVTWGSIYEAMAKSVRGDGLSFTNELGKRHSGKSAAEAFVNYFLRSQKGHDILIKKVSEGMGTKPTPGMSVENWLAINPEYHMVVLNGDNVKSAYAEEFVDNSNIYLSKKNLPETPERLKGEEVSNGRRTGQNEKGPGRGVQETGGQNRTGAGNAAAEVRDNAVAPQNRGVGDETGTRVRGIRGTEEKSNDLRAPGKSGQETGKREIVARVASQFKTMSSQWANGPKGGLLALSSDDISIPTSGREAIKSAKKSGQVIEGYFDPRTDTAYVFPDLVQPLQNESIEQASTRVALEEVMRHKGIREAFGGKFEPMNQFLRDLFVSKRKQINDVGIFDTYGWDAKNKLHQQYAAEEWFAHHFDEARDGKGWVRRFADLVRRFARDTLGVKLGVTDSEIRDMARKSREAITEGRVGGALQKTGGVQVMKGINQFAQDVKMSLAEATKKITDNPNFRKWFGNSKVVDSKGDPLVMYHGTSEGDITVFDTFSGVRSLFTAGSYFTSSPKVSGEYAKTRAKQRGGAATVYPAYLSISNPIDMDAVADKGAWEAAFEEYKNNFKWLKDGATNTDFFNEVAETLVMEEIPDYEAAEIMREAFESMGYDGITHTGGKRVKGATEEHRVYVAFSPTQIKSIFNQGTFDPTNPDILKSVKIGNESVPVLFSKKPALSESVPADPDREALPSGVNDRMKAAQGLPAKEWHSRTVDRLKMAWREARQKYPLLDMKKHAKASVLFRVLESQNEASRGIAIRTLSDITRDLAPNEYTVFSRVLMLNDLISDIERGTIDEDLVRELPFGFKNLAEIKASRDKYAAMGEKSESVKTAWGQHKDVFKKFTEDMVKLKLLPKETLKREDYWHHQVLIYRAMEAAGNTAGISTAQVRPGMQGWQRKRKGSIKDYNTDYLQSYYEVLAGGLTQMEVQKTLNEIRKTYDISEKLQAEADKINAKVALEPATLDGKNKVEVGSMVRPTDRHNIGTITEIDQESGDVTVHFYNRQTQRSDDVVFDISKLEVPKKDDFVNWMDLVGNPQYPEYKDYKIWYDKPGGIHYQTYSLMDKAAQRVMSGIAVVNKNELHKVTAVVSGEVMALPAGIADTMSNLKMGRDLGAIEGLTTSLMSAWKAEILFMPLRAIKYNVNNMSGDLDVVLGYKPGIMRFFGRAAWDLVKMAHNKRMDPASLKELQSAQRHAVIGSGMTAKEITDLYKVKEFQRLMSQPEQSIPRKMAAKALNVPMAVFDVTKGISEWRENILRLAAFRYFKERLGKGEKLYGASPKAVVDSIEDIDTKAALLARELLGDYGNLTMLGETMRQKYIPFWSWQEINAPRYVRLMKNAFHEGAGGKKVGLMIGTKASLYAARRLAMASMLMVAVSVWNHFKFPDEEDELGLEGMKQLHLILGRDKDGEIMTLRFQGAFSDALSWFGGENIVSDLANLKDGTMTEKEYLTDTWQSPINKFVSGIRPDFKLAMESIYGESLFPDVFSPRPIRDYGENLMKSLALDTLYRHARNMPSKRNLYGDLLAQLLVYSTDPDQGAYYDAMNIARKWNEDNGTGADARIIVRPGSKPANLKMFKLAMRYGDDEAAMKYLGLLRKQYDSDEAMMDGITKSIDKAHPLAFIKKEDRPAFLQSLTPRQRSQVVRAIDWYEETYRSDTDSKYRRAVSDSSGTENKDTVKYRELKKSQGEIADYDQAISDISENKPYYVGSGSIPWAKRKTAEKRQAELKAIGIETVVKPVKGGGGYYLERTSPAFSQAEIDEKTQPLRDERQAAKQRFYEDWENGFKEETVRYGINRSTKRPFKSQEAAKGYMHRLQAPGSPYADKQYRVVRVLKKDGYDKDGYMVELVQ